MKRNFLFFSLALILAVTIFLTYFNHFHNGFHFDDSHTIVDNPYIRDMRNFTKFFTDATTLTPLNANQSYRPMVTLSYAIDYNIGGKLDPFYFHVSNFFWYMIQLVLMYFLFIKIFNLASKQQLNKIFALFAVGWYGLHTAHAETINYICARSDSFSTLFVIIAFLMYIYSPFSRKWFLYFIPVILGTLVKPTALMFAPLLFCYILLFEKNISLTEFFKKKNRKSVIKIIKLTLPVFILVVILYVLQAKMTPETFTPGITPRFNYIITQPFVFVHYIRTFFLPNALSADSDWSPLATIWDYRFFVGLIINIAIITIAFFTSKKSSTRPIAFGILWFYLALVPTSVIPFAEVLNDHRIFYPYVGLMISVCWTLALLYYKYEKIIKNNMIYQGIIIYFALFILTANAFGTVQRNKVWKTDEALWHDVTIKSPKNGRGLMNYGLTKMQIGKYDEALQYFEKSLQYNPTYTCLYINIAIVKGAMNKPIEAEENFKKAIQFGQEYSAAYYFYAQWLNRHNRNKEAIPLLIKAIELSPASMEPRYLLMKIYSNEYKWDKLAEFVQQTLQLFPNDPTSLQYAQTSKNRKSKIEEALDLVKQKPTAENYLDLSMNYYNEHKYEECIDACNKAIKIKPDYAEAYNNICSAYNAMNKWDKAIAACNKCLKIKPDYQLAKNNLKFSLQNKK